MSSTKAKLSKAQAIRQYLTDHPDSTVDETIQGIREQYALRVTKTNVYQTKCGIRKQVKTSGSGSRFRKANRTSQNGSPTADLGHGCSLSMSQAADLLINAARFRRRFLSITEAKNALDLVEKLISSAPIQKDQA